jgi:ribonuclease BN (tRNA processing enzyme)
VWQVANETPNLKAVITECSFPNRLQAIADISLHLTPRTLAIELAKLKGDVPVLIYHFKPPYIDELRAELASTALPCAVEELVQDRTYIF